MPRDTREDEEAGQKSKSLSTNPRSIRARARRRQKSLDVELKKLYKPLKDWDPEELARGRPRNKKGDFRGRPPKWITPEICEEAKKRFKDEIRADMAVATTAAVKKILSIVEDEEVDENGRPITPDSVKLEASKFLIEHLIGKPKQEVGGELSVRLQALLGVAIVNPDGTPSQGFVEAGSDPENDDD